MTNDIKQRIEMINRGEVPEGYRKTKVGIVPSEWECVRLKKIANVFDGTHQTPKYESSGVKFVSVENIESLSTTNKFISEEDFEKFTIKPRVNDILMTRITAGEIGATAIVESNEPMAFYVSLALIRCNDYLNIKFLNQFIRNATFKHELYKRIIHVAFPKKINLGEIGECLITLPPLPEQEKIVQVLTACDNIIELKEKLIAEKQAQKKWLMQNLLTGKKRLHGFTGEWEKVKLGDLCDFIKNGYTYEETISENYVMITRIETISNSIINLNAVGHSEPNIDNKFLLRRGDILFSHINSLAQIGKTAYFDLDEKLYHGMNLLCIRANSKTNSKYLFYWLNSDVSQTMYMMYAKKAVNQCSISASELLKYQLLVPSYQEQTAIANILSTADHEIKLLQNNLAEWENKKKGLMQLLLTGKVRTLSVNCG